MSHPPYPLEVLSADQEISSPRNSANVAPASVTLSVPVMSESHQGQEQVLLSIPYVPTMPSACSDPTTIVNYVTVSYLYICNTSVVHMVLY